MTHTANVNAEHGPVIERLLAAKEPWVVYNTLHDLAGAAPDSAQAQAAYPSSVTLLRIVQ